MKWVLCIENKGNGDFWHEAILFFQKFLYFATILKLSPPL